MLQRDPLSDRAVHAVRKDLKRARAMLRLIRTALGERAYHRDNAAMRDVARTLGAARDSKILLDTFQGLPKSGQAVTAGRAETDLRSRLKREHTHFRGQLRDDRPAVRHACRSLRAIKRRLAGGRADRYACAVLELGVRRVYAHGRATLRHSQKRPTAQNLHELRKQTKYLWHQLEALATRRDQGTEALAAATHKLSDLLGDDHNLTVLRGKVLDASLRPRAQEELLASIDAKHARLVRQALTLAQRIYRDPPARFAARVARCPARL